MSFWWQKNWGINGFVKPLWLDNAAKPQDKDVFIEVDEIMRQAISENDKNNPIGSAQSKHVAQWAVACANFIRMMNTIPWCS